MKPTSLDSEKFEKPRGRPSAGRVHAADLKILHPAVVNAIMAKVASVYGLQPNTILSRDRHAFIAEARQVVMTLLVNRGATYGGVARVMNRSNHGTVLHARRKVGELIEVDSRTKLRWNFVKHHGDPDIPITPTRRYKVYLNSIVEVLAEGDLDREELERRAVVRLFEGRAAPNMVGSEKEVLSAQEK